MAVSSHEEKMINIQYQMRQNQQDLQDYLSDLGNWEDEIKQKEEALKKKKSDELQDLPPVRNSLEKKKLKKKKKKKTDPQTKSKKISGFDFRAWDKFDVDKALEEIDGQEDKKSSSEYETDEEWETERRKHLANEEKNNGNSHMSAGAYDVAIECYTRGIELDPTNALLPANRALALIKTEKYGAAEVDCTTAIALDPLYVKAYLRRAAARVGLQRLEPALEDYQRVLQLEPTNSQAKTETVRIEKEIQREKENPKLEASSLEKTETTEVKPVYKPPEQRSKKPLQRIQIEEIGIKENTDRISAIAKVEAQQSSVKKDMEAKDGQLFEKFTTKTSISASGDGDSKLSGGKDAKDDSQAKSQSPKFSGKENGLTTKDCSSHASSSAQEDAAGKTQGSTENKPSSSKPLSPRGGAGSATIASPLDRKPPQTSFQFQADFKILKNDLHSFYAYFKRIDPGLYPKLFGQSLEAPVLLTILESLRECCILANEDCFQHLQNLANVKRFSMIVMFLSSKDKKGIVEIFQYLKRKGSHSEAEVDALMKKYEV